MTVSTIVSFVFGSGGVVLVSTVLNYTLKRRRSRMDTGDTVMARLEAENARLYDRALRLESERNAYQDLAHRYRGQLGQAGIKVDDT